MSRITRDTSSIRTVNVRRDFCPASDGSVLFEMGNTRVICATHVSDDVPQHAKEKGTGWVTAEYSMLPYSTSPRSPRRLARPDGRSVEIQRLIGRSLRRSVDLKKLAGYSIIVDCDVLQADGGTRTAGITGGFIALNLAISGMIEKGMLHETPVIAGVAAISVGFVENELLLDLEYSEDSQADVDMNVVMDSNYNLVEIQGTGENTSFSFAQLDEMLSLAKNGIEQLFAIQKEYSIR
ncbi:MAG TPA: ribonuclease PH [Spirochaetota bacterium]|nr:ribonuclease PH [Spirochaetota bacterium]